MWVQLTRNDKKGEMTIAPEKLLNKWHRLVSKIVIVAQHVQVTPQLGPFLIFADIHGALLPKYTHTCHKTERFHMA